MDGREGGGIGPGRGEIGVTLEASGGLPGISDRRIHWLNSFVDFGGWDDDHLELVGHKRKTIQLILHDSTCP